MLLEQPRSALAGSAVRERRVAGRSGWGNRGWAGRSADAARRQYSPKSQTEAGRGKGFRRAHSFAQRSGVGKGKGKVGGVRRPAASIVSWARGRNARVARTVAHGGGPSMLAVCVSGPGGDVHTCAAPIRATLSQARQGDRPRGTQDPASACSPQITRRKRKAWRSRKIWTRRVGTNLQ